MPKKTPIKSFLNELKNSEPHLLRHMRQEYVDISPDMPLKKMAELASGSKTMYAMFQPVLNEAKLASPLLKAVVEGGPAQLIQLVQEDPLRLFKKGQIKDPAGRVFYNVSAYQMMKYLCDDDMIAQVMPHVPEKITNEHGLQIDFKAIQTEQDQNLQRGGADLIKLNFDPTNQADFDNILQHTETYTINAQTHPVTFSLMENPDAILYYKDTDGNPHWYYANRETQTIECIEPQSKTEKEAELFANLKQSIDAMENNSARRSSDVEHNIIKKSMQKNLIRNGIKFEHNDKCFCDTHHDFNRFYNAYRKCLRLYEQGNLGEGSTVWCKEIGRAQKEVMWLLQRYCEENKPFFPLPYFKSSPFRRSLQIQNISNNSREDIYSSGRFVANFGFSFAIYKTSGEIACADGERAMWHIHGGFVRQQLKIDLVAINRLIEDAKANVIEFKSEATLSQGMRPR